MTCKACGYAEEWYPCNDPFIELRGMERGPFTITCGPNNEPLGVGQPTKLYACPQCGTVRMEVEG